LIGATALLFCFALLLLSGTTLAQSSACSADREFHFALSTPSEPKTTDFFSTTSFRQHCPARWFSYHSDGDRLCATVIDCSTGPWADPEMLAFSAPPNEKRDRVPNHSTNASDSRVQGRQITLALQDGSLMCAAIEVGASHLYHAGERRFDGGARLRTLSDTARCRVKRTQPR
jgi:hypothetical protein